MLLLEIFCVIFIILIIAMLCNNKYVHLIIFNRIIGTIIIVPPIYFSMLFLFGKLLNNQNLLNTFSFSHSLKLFIYQDPELKYFLLLWIGFIGISVITWLKTYCENKYIKQSSFLELTKSEIESKKIYTQLKDEKYIDKFGKIVRNDIDYIYNFGKYSYDITSILKKAKTYKKSNILELSLTRFIAIYCINYPLILTILFYFIHIVFYLFLKNKLKLCPTQIFQIQCLAAFVLGLCVDMIWNIFRNLDKYLLKKLGDSI
jgi:hypothetical protein